MKKFISEQAPILWGVFILIMFGLWIGVSYYTDARQDGDRSPNVITGGVGGDAETLDTIDSAQFIRSDTDDSVTGSSTTTWGSGNNVKVQGDFLEDNDNRINVKAYGIDV